MRKNDYLCEINIIHRDNYEKGRNISIIPELWKCSLHDWSENPISGFPKFESATFLSNAGQSNEEKTDSQSAEIERKPMIEEQNSGFSYSITHPTGAESAVFVSTDASRLSVSQMIDMESIRQQLVAANSKKPTVAKINKLCDNIKVNEVFGSKLVTQILNCSETQARSIINKLKELKLIEPVAKQGKGKYIFKS